MFSLVTGGMDFGDLHEINKINRRHSKLISDWFSFPNTKEFKFEN